MVIGPPGSTGVMGLGSYVMCGPIAMMFGNMMSNIMVTLLLQEHVYMQGCKEIPTLVATRMVLASSQTPMYKHYTITGMWNWKVPRSSEESSPAIRDTRSCIMVVRTHRCEARLRS